MIEVDGSQHGDDVRIEQDAVRDAVLRRQGFTVLRFWASDVRRNLDWLMDQIVATLEAAQRVHHGARTQARSLDLTSPP